jgi:biopolymer transport protein ExbB
MAGAAALQRMKLEKRLVYLATLGNNAPFIGLFGTVIGVVDAFEALGAQSKQTVAEVANQALAPTQVMSSIAEALVATAIGIFVAIPAVAANNYFQRATKSILANTEALSRVLLSHLRARDDIGPIGTTRVAAPATEQGEHAEKSDKGKAWGRSTDGRDRDRRAAGKDEGKAKGSRKPPDDDGTGEDEPSQDG